MTNFDVLCNDLTDTTTNISINTFYLLTGRKIKDYILSNKIAL